MRTRIEQIINADLSVKYRIQFKKKWYRPWYYLHDWSETPFHTFIRPYEVYEANVYADAFHRLELFLKEQESIKLEAFRKQRELKIGKIYISKRHD